MEQYRQFRTVSVYVVDTRQESQITHFRAMWTQPGHFKDELLCYRGCSPESSFSFILIPNFYNPRFEFFKHIDFKFSFLFTILFAPFFCSVCLYFSNYASASFCHLCILPFPDFPCLRLTPIFLMTLPLHEPQKNKHIAVRLEDSTSRFHSYI